MVLQESAALETLNVGGNQITSRGANAICEALKSAPIRDIYFSGNLLDFVPPSLAQFRSLRRLYLRENKLTSLPPFLGAMPALKDLFTDDNPLAGELGRIQPDQRLRYLQELNKLSVPNKTVQVITLGHQMVGKSTLLLALRTSLKWIGKTKVPKLDRTTEVVLCDVPDKKYHWRFRDLPGQTEFYATNARFLTADRAVLLVVIDVSKEDQRESQLLQWS